MRFLFLGKSKAWSILALQYLVGRQVNVGLVVVSDLSEPLAQKAMQVGIPVTTDLNVSGEFDVGLAYLFRKKLPECLVNLPRMGILNFHSAPLPDYRGVGGITFAILDHAKEWGVTVHRMNGTIDTGPILEARRFTIDPDKETALSLDIRSQTKLFELYMDTVDKLIRGEPLQFTPQPKQGRYISLKDFHNARTIREGDDAERKRRAYYYPPYEGVKET